MKSCDNNGSHYLFCKFGGFYFRQYFFQDPKKSSICNKSKISNFDYGQSSWNAEIDLSNNKIWPNLHHLKILRAILGPGPKSKIFLQKISNLHRTRNIKSGLSTIVIMTQSTSPKSILNKGFFIWILDK